MDCVLSVCATCEQDRESFHVPLNHILPCHLWGIQAESTLFMKLLVRSNKAGYAMMMWVILVNLHQSFNLALAALVCFTI